MQTCQLPSRYNWYETYQSPIIMHKERQKLHKCQNKIKFVQIFTLNDVEIYTVVLHFGLDTCQIKLGFCTGQLRSDWKVSDVSCCYFMLCNNAWCSLVSTPSIHSAWSGQDKAMVSTGVYWYYWQSVQHCNLLWVWLGILGGPVTQLPKRVLAPWEYSTICSKWTNCCNKYLLNCYEFHELQENKVHNCSLFWTYTV